MALGKDPARYRTQAFALGGALMGLAGAIGAHFIGFTAPENYQSILTFQIWTMLIVGGSGIRLWALWGASGLAIGAFVPPEFEARAAALRIAAIGLLLATMIVLRPRGIFGERATVSRFLDQKSLERKTLDRVVA